MIDLMENIVPYFAGVTIRPGIEIYAYCPHRIVYMRAHEKTGMIAFTLRGAYWCRPGKKARRIAAIR